MTGAGLDAPNVKQPPSGGCVLKLVSLLQIPTCHRAATFGWLCVETMYQKWKMAGMVAATFGWLCVETIEPESLKSEFAAATFGWLCVETFLAIHRAILRWAATFGWLCVET